MENILKLSCGAYITYEDFDFRFGYEDMQTTALVYPIIFHGKLMLADPSQIGFRHGAVHHFINDLYFMTMMDVLPEDVQYEEHLTELIAFIDKEDMAFTTGPISYKKTGNEFYAGDRHIEPVIFYYYGDWRISENRPIFYDNRYYMIREITADRCPLQDLADCVSIL